MTDVNSIYDQATPVMSEFPADIKFATPGDFVQGQVTAVRMFEDTQNGLKKPIWDIAVQDCSPTLATNQGIAKPGETYSVICGAASLRAHALNLRPQIGESIRISFDSFSGQRKNFSVSKVDALEVAAKANASAAADAVVQQGDAPWQA